MPVHHAGIGSIQKAMLLLRLVAAQGPQRLAQLTAASGLNKVTALRILSMLVQEGMLRRLEDGLHYDLGPEAMVIAAASERRIDLRQAARASLTRLAALSDDTVILSVRSGLESLCLAIEAGNFPIRANYLEVGSRRPLGISAGSMALLAWQSDAERDAVMEALTPRYRDYPRLSITALRRRVLESRQRGYVVVLNQLVDRIGAIGVPVLAPSGAVLAALSIAALTDRITLREAKLAAALQREAAVIAASLA